MGGLILLRPLWLPAGAVLILALWWRLGRARGLGDWPGVIAPHLLDAMRALGRVRDGGATPRWRHPLLWAAACIVLGLSGPSLATRNATAFRNLDGVVLVMDVSPSMIEGEAWPAAVTAGRTLLGAIGSRPAALVVYAGDAYLGSELTADTLQVGYTLSLLEPGTVPDPGSRPERALALAADVLDEARIVAGDVVWITDGGGASAELAPVLARIGALGGEVTILRASTEHGGPLEAAARLAGAAIFDVTDREGFADHLADGAAQRLGRIDIALIGRTDLGPLLLIPALLLLIGVMRRTA